MYSLRWSGSIISAVAVPRVQPRKSVQGSLCTFVRPFIFIWLTAHSIAFCAAGEPVTRPPTVSVSSARHAYAPESNRLSPTALTRPALVSSSLNTGH